MGKGKEEKQSGQTNNQVFFLFLCLLLKEQLIVNSLLSSFFAALMSLTKIHTHLTNALTMKIHCPTPKKTQE